MGGFVMLFISRKHVGGFQCFSGAYCSISGVASCRWYEIGRLITLNLTHPITSCHKFKDCNITIHLSGKPEIFVLIGMLCLSLQTGFTTKLIVNHVMTVSRYRINSTYWHKSPVRNLISKAEF